MTRYQFLIDTYETERLKVLSVWSMFRDADLPARPHPTDLRGRNLLEHMVHQCTSENNWFKGMLGIDVDAPRCPRSRAGWVSSSAMRKTRFGGWTRCGIGTKPGGNAK